MPRVTLSIIAVAFVALHASAQLATSPTTRPAVDPKVQDLLHKSCNAVSGLKQFTFEAHSTFDAVLSNGQKVQFAQNQKLFVRRPNTLAAIVQGDRDDLRFWYDGKRVGAFNVRQNIFSAADAPPTIDATLDLLANTYGVAMPLADVVLSDPYKALAEHAQTGVYLGTGYVFDAVCHHLAFHQDQIDWEIWVDTAKDPLPRKIVITYKNSPQSPQYTAFLSNWDLSPTFPDGTFASPVPKGAKELPFVAKPATQPARVP